MLRYVKVPLSKLSVDRILRIGLLIIAVAGAVSAITSMLSTSSVANSARLPKDASLSSSGRQRIEGELIALRPTGFEPKQIRRPAGRPFLLAVENQSRLPGVSLVLNSSVNLPLLNAPLPREKRIWSDVLNLPPGIYTLTEVNHSGWVCTITVE